LTTKKAGVRALAPQPGQELFGVMADAEASHLQVRSGQRGRDKVGRGQDLVFGGGVRVVGGKDRLVVKDEDPWKWHC
jgi:hypothetical protein